MTRTFAFDSTAGWILPLHQLLWRIISTEEEKGRGGVAWVNDVHTQGKSAVVVHLDLFAIKTREFMPI